MHKRSKEAAAKWLLIKFATEVGNRHISHLLVASWSQIGAIAKICLAYK